MAITFSESLRTLVTQKFAQARSSQKLIFSETLAANLRGQSGITYQLRFCPSLSKKPIDNKPTTEPQNKPAPTKVDPFENPSHDLYIAPVAASHLLVLNKFPVIENHFILATKANKAQTGLLEPDDLGSTYACIQAWAHDAGTDAEKTLFAFFNSGEHSGASQPHRHLQFLPVSDMRITSPEDWKLLVSEMSEPVPDRPGLLYSSKVPVVHFATEISPVLSEQELHARYVLLLEAALDAIKKASPPSSSLQTVAQIVEDEVTTFSYNLAVTTTLMAILPRRNEAYTFRDLPSGNSVSINGTILSGSMMVKEEIEWERLRHNPFLLDEVLAEIGYPLGATRSTTQHNL